MDSTPARSHARLDSFVDRYAARTAGMTVGNFTVFITALLTAAQSLRQLANRQAVFAEGFTAARRLFHDEQPIELSVRELAVIELLLSRQGRVVSKEQMIDQLFGWGDYVGGNAIEVYVHRVRKKLEPLGVERRLIGRYDERNLRLVGRSARIADRCPLKLGR